MAGPTGDFDWFTTWVDQHLGLGLTFARGSSRRALLEAFSLQQRATADLAEQTFDEAAYDSATPKVRLGGLDGWGYAVEHLTTRGADPDTLRRLSVAGGQALALSFTQSISSFHYAEGGEYVCGFDLVVPHIRWGNDPHRFDTAMEQAGVLQPPPRQPAPALGARLVRLILGITIDRHMLERALPSVDVA